ncbi:MAG: hypothetical protein AABY16_01955 [Nanoarchaeota archaeon]
MVSSKTILFLSASQCSALLSLDASKLRTRAICCTATFASCLCSKCLHKKFFHSEKFLCSNFIEVACILALKCEVFDVGTLT